MYNVTDLMDALLFTNLCNSKQIIYYTCRDTCFNLYYRCKFNLRKKNVTNFIFCSLVRENYTKFFLIIIVKKGKEQNLHITTPTTTTKSAVEENAQKHKSTNQS